MIKKFLNLFIFKIKNPTCSVHSSAHVSRKTRVGKNCLIGERCNLSASVFLGDNVVIGDGAHLKNIVINNNTMIESGVRVVGTGKGNIMVGSDSYIGINNVLDTSDNIMIGNFVHIAGPSTGLWCHSSVQMCLNNIPLNDLKRDEYRITKSITIEDNVYIGGNSTIYPGIKIGHHSVIAPNSAVNRSVENNTFVGGVPARILKKLV